MGIVYILTNPAMPDLVKIGRTEDTIERRVKDLNTTSVPLPFEVFYAAQVDDAEGWERALHEAFSDRRINPRREFFRLSPDKPHAVLVMAEKTFNAKNVTPEYDYSIDLEESNASNKEKSRRSPFNFDMVNIKPGSILKSVFDENAICKVIDNKYVNYIGERLSLSEAALRVARATNRNWPAVAGPDYWLYEGETLMQIRKNLEEDVT